MVPIDHLRYQMAGDGHLKVWRDDGQDGISWDELQAVKNEVFGSEAWCIEHYPAASMLVDQVPIRHLWLVAEPQCLPQMPPRSGY